MSNPRDIEHVLEQLDAELVSDVSVQGEGQLVWASWAYLGWRCRYRGMPEGYRLMWVGFSATAPDGTEVSGYKRLDQLEEAIHAAEALRVKRGVWAAADKALEAGTTKLPGVS